LKHILLPTKLIFFSITALKVTGEWRRLHNEELNDLYLSAFYTSRAAVMEE
jgi:hypothetical protein